MTQLSLEKMNRRQEFIDSFNYELENGLLITSDFDYEYEWAVPSEDTMFLRTIEKINLYECKSQDEIEEELVSRRCWVLSVYPEFVKDIPFEFLKGYGYDMCITAIRANPMVLHEIPDEILLSYDRDQYFNLCEIAVSENPSVLYDSNHIESDSQINQKFRYLSDFQIDELTLEVPKMVLLCLN